MAIDSVARGLAASKASIQNLSNYSITRTLPSGFGWGSRYDLGTIRMNVSPGGKIVASTGLTIASIVGDYSGYQTRYITVTGNDSNDGLTEATAWLTCGKARTVIMAAGGNWRVRIKGGNVPYYRASVPGTSTATLATRIVWENYGGRAQITTSDNLVWSADGTNAWLSNATGTAGFSAATGIGLDLSTIKPNGLYEEMTRLYDASAATRLPYLPRAYTVSGTAIKAYSPTTLATGTNTRLLANVNNCGMRGTLQWEEFWLSEDSGGGFDFQGGSGVVSWAFTGNTGGNYVAIGARNCTFRYSGGASSNVADYSQNAVTLEGINGLAIFENCDASGGANDNWNPHNLLNADMRMLLINCTGFDAGRGTSVSCNNVTGHEDNLRVLVLGGEYRTARGRSFDFINNSKVCAIGVTIGGSLGDLPNGGAKTPAEVSLADTAMGWLDFCRLQPNPGGAAAIAQNGTQLFIRDMFPATGPYVTSGTGTILPY